MTFRTFQPAALALGALLLGALSGPAHAALITVYSQTFDAGSTPTFIAPGVTTVGGTAGWSQFTTDADSIIGDPGSIYGRFPNAGVSAIQSLSLTGLAPHTAIHVTLDIIPRGGWDGNNSPDVFRIWHTINTIFSANDMLRVTFYQPGLGSGSFNHSWPDTWTSPTPPSYAVPGPNYRTTAGDQSEWSVVTTSGAHSDTSLLLGFQVHADTGESMMLDNLVIAIEVEDAPAPAIVPEPTALALLALPLLMRRRRRD